MGVPRTKCSIVPFVLFPRRILMQFSTRSARPVSPPFTKPYVFPRANSWQITLGKEDAMAQRTLKEQLEEAEQHSKEVLDQLLDESTTRDEFRTLMKSYVGYRFFLEPEEMKTDVILDLAEDSVEKLLSINDLSVTLSEGSQTCTNQSSTDIKKVLLSLTLQRAMGIKFTPEESAGLDTIDKLACALFDAKNDSTRAR